MGRFLLGFVIGAALGAAAVIITAPRSGRDTRDGIRQLIDDTREVARQAKESQERELWNVYRARLEGTSE